MEYVKIRSYHIVRTWTRVPGRYITLCGRRGESFAAVPTLPLDEKSCETCLRVKEHNHE